MATTKTRTALNADADLIAWNLAANEAGEAEFGCSEFDDRSVQISGVFDGATLVIEGTNDEAEGYETLRDTGLLALSFIGKDLKQMLEYTHGFRARTVGGGVNCDVRVRVIAKRKRGR
jgi:hypothetical protein